MQTVLPSFRYLFIILLIHIENHYKLVCNRWINLVWIKMAIPRPDYKTPKEELKFVGLERLIEKLTERNILYIYSIRFYRFVRCRKDNCTFTATTLQHLSEHNRTHSGQRVTCNFCGKTFSNQGNLCRHKSNEHYSKTTSQAVQTDISVADSIRCLRCGETYSKLKNHTAYAHTLTCKKWIDQGKFEFRTTTNEF